jgi:hypothetical protein
MGVTLVNRLCCQSCRLRFPPIAEAYLTACPECGGQPTAVQGPGSLIGFRLLSPAEIAGELPEAIAASLLIPTLDGIGRSLLDP